VGYFRTAKHHGDRQPPPSTATAFKNRREWITGTAQRRVEFADRSVYLQLMERLEPQGISDASPQPTRYRRTAARLIRGR